MNWSLSKGAFGFYDSYFLVSEAKRVSACQLNPIPRESLAPAPLIASSTIFKLSLIVSKGQMKVQSGEYFKAASPPFPDTIAFLTPWRTVWRSPGSVTYFATKKYLKTLHFDPITFPPWRQLTMQWILLGSLWSASYAKSL